MPHLDAKLQGFTDWFQNNPGHAVRALPLTFSVFSIIMGVGILLPGGAASAFVTAAIVASIAGVIHVGWRYLKATFLVTRPAGEASGPRGMTLVDILMWLSIAPILLMAVTWGISAALPHSAR